ncbi:MAG: DUF58 domain-containing protein [Oligoflexia bacterium]|nr:DUF58 domain-containing protein [Oligoflexia bacterium]
MKFWKKFQLRASEKTLQISKGGWLYLIFVVLLGAAAVISGNNILYLLESLLLSSILFSGFVSENTIYSLVVNYRPKQAIANQPLSDKIECLNTSFFPLFCIEIGLVQGKKLKPLSFLLYLPRGEKKTIPCHGSNFDRGKVSWDALYIATSFPFGFAKKIRYLSGSGDRIVWPSLDNTYKYKVPEDSLMVGDEEMTGQVAVIDWSKDARRIHWPTSSRVGLPVEVSRGQLNEKRFFTLDLLKQKNNVEKAISKAASLVFYKNYQLILIDTNGCRKYENHIRALNELSLVETNYAN